MTPAPKPPTTSGKIAKRRIAIVGKQMVAYIDDNFEILLASNRRVEIVSSARSIKEFHDAEIHIDVAILDLCLEDIESARSTISAVAPLYPVMVISASARREDMMAALQAGASGYVTRNASSDAIIEAAETIATGGLCLCSPVSGVIGDESSPAQPAGQPISLSPREKEALLHISRGLTQAQTATRMGVSPSTVDTYVKRIRRKVGPGNKADLTRQAISLGFLEPESIHELAPVVGAGTRAIAVDGSRAAGPWRMDRTAATSGDVGPGLPGPVRQRPSNARQEPAWRLLWVEPRRFGR